MDNPIVIINYSKTEDGINVYINNDALPKFTNLIEKGAEQLNLKVILEDYAAKPTTTIDDI